MGWIELDLTLGVIIGMALSYLTYWLHYRHT